MTVYRDSTFRLSTSCGVIFADGLCFSSSDIGLHLSTRNIFPVFFQTLYNPTESPIADISFLVENLAMPSSSNALLGSLSFSFKNLYSFSFFTPPRSGVLRSSRPSGRSSRRRSLRSGDRLSRRRLGDRRGRRGLRDRRRSLSPRRWCPCSLFLVWGGNVFIPTSLTYVPELAFYTPGK